MDNLIAQLADFLADYNVDLYDEANLGGEKYRIDCVIVENNIGSLKARLMLQRAFNAFNTFPDSPKGVTVVQTAPIVMNERSEDEYDFSVNIEFKKTDERLKAEAESTPVDERPFTEEINDSIDVKAVRGKNVSEFWGAPAVEEYEEIEDIEVKSDISGKEIIDGEGYHLPDGRDVTIAEAMDIYREDYHQRAAEGDLLTDDLNEKAKWDAYTADEFKESFGDFADLAKYTKLTEENILKIWRKQK